MATRKKARAKKKASTKRKPRLVGLKALAREIGVSPTAVQKAIADGRIKPAVVSEPAGPGRPWQIDSTKAKRLWKARTNATHRPIEELRNRAKKAAESDPEAATPESAVQENLPLGEDEAADGWGDARARKILAEARLKEMEADQRAGRLIDRAEAEHTIQAAFQLARDKVQSIGATYAGELATIDDPAEIERFLYFKIEQVLTETADAIEGLGGGGSSSVDGAAA